VCCVAANQPIKHSYFNDDGDSTRASVFGVNWYSCQDQQSFCNPKQNGCKENPACPGANAIFTDEFKVHHSRDKTGPNTWTKSLVVGEYRGPISFDLFAPLPLAFFPSCPNGGPVCFLSSVKDCTEFWNNEMGGELCMALGDSWTVDVDGSQSKIVLEVFPAFGMGTGSTSNLLKQVASDFSEPRDIPVFIPRTVMQNQVPRPVNVMLVLDGALEVVEKFSTQGGFESGQQSGYVPESVMIGIDTTQFVLTGAKQTMCNATTGECKLVSAGGDQRGYELTYELPASENKSETCVGGVTGGGTHKMLEWVDLTVIPEVLKKLGNMTRGEVSIAGGSIAGLTTCYAATSRPDFVSRAVCMSPSNCFNHRRTGEAGLVKHIKANFENLKKLPKAVIQYQGMWRCCCSGLHCTPMRLRALALALERRLQHGAVDRFAKGCGNLVGAPGRVCIQVPRCTARIS